MSRRRSWSLRARLLLLGSASVMVFLGFAWAALERAFVNDTAANLRARLDAEIYAVLGAMEVQGGQARIFDERLATALNVPQSGRVAVLADARGREIWRSNSGVGLSLPPPQVLPPGRSVFSLPGQTGWYRHTFGFAWVVEPGHRVIPFTLSLLDDGAALRARLGEFRRQLGLWFGVAIGVLLTGQFLILSFGLAPLNQLGRELVRVEQGRQPRIQGRYPPELARLGARINQFISSERAAARRQRRAFGDLAHSLKTPLAVISGLADERRLGRESATVDEHIARMNRIIDYQLQRAGRAASGVGQEPVEINPLLHQLAASLDKVYADKGVVVSWHLDAAARFYGNADDWLELAGVLLDNGYKFTRSRVRITSRSLPGEGRSGLDVRIADDGLGVPPERRRMVLARGARLDERTLGQGLGLAVAAEIAGRYGGELELGESDWGGCEVCLRFAAAGAGE